MATLRTFSSSFKSVCYGCGLVEDQLHAFGAMVLTSAVYGGEMAKSEAEVEVFIGSTISLLMFSSKVLWVLLTLTRTRRAGLILTPIRFLISCQKYTISYSQDEILILLSLKLHLTDKTQFSEHAIDMV